MPLILLSEDDVSIRTVITSMLTANGHEVIGVDNGMDAIDELLKIQSCFDLIITDLNMPGMNGHELAYAAKVLFPDLPIILISGHLTPKSSLKAYGDTIATFIEKPFSINKLCKLVGEITNSKCQSETSLAAE